MLEKKTWEIRAIYWNMLDVGLEKIYQKCVQNLIYGYNIYGTYIENNMGRTYGITYRAKESVVVANTEKQRQLQAILLNYWTTRPNPSRLDEESGMTSLLRLIHVGPWVPKVSQFDTIWGEVLKPYPEKSCD